MNVQLENRTDQLSALNQSDTLLIAIGNSARSDDGLGWAFFDQVKKSETFKGELNACYQLQVEDAELIAKYPNVIFVDATGEDMDEGFAIEHIEAENDFTFTTHALSPEAVLYLCKELYQSTPKACVLKIKGHDWALKIGLSNDAKSNLKEALAFFNKEILI